MRRRVVTRVTDETGAVGSSVVCYLLRSGAALTTGGATSITANNTATVRVKHPGALKLNDVVYWLDTDGSTNGSYNVNSTPTFNASGYWEVVLLDLSGSDTTIGTDGNLVLQWSDSDHYVKWYDDDTGGSGTSGVISPSSTTGELKFYVEEPDIDIAITQGGVLSAYVCDVPVERRDWVTPEEFGATGDGSTDDSVPFQAAMNYVSEIDGGGVVWCASPDGYAVSGVSATSVDVLLMGYSIPADVTGGKPRVMFGSGTPESNVIAPIGSIFMRTDGGGSTAVYIKESGSGNTGWVALADVSSPTMSGDIDLNGNSVAQMSVVAESTAGAATTTPNANTGFLVITGTGTAISKISGCADGKVLQVMFSNATPNTLSAAATPADDEILTALSPTQYQVYTLVGWDDGSNTRWVVS